MDKPLTFQIGILIVCLLFLLAAVLLRPPMKEQQHPRLLGLQSELDGSGVDLDSENPIFATDETSETPSEPVRSEPTVRGDTETVF